MVEVKIYPACLKCDYSRFVGETGHVNFPCSNSEGKHDAHIKCEYEHICKFIDGQEPISIEGKIADLVVDDEKSVIATCSACKANYITIDHHLEHLDYCTRCGAKFERNMVREYLNGEPIETGNTGGK